LFDPEKWSGCIQRFDYRLFNSSNSIILWSCILYKHSFIFLIVFVSRWSRYSSLLYLQKCQNLKNIRTIHPPTVTLTASNAQAYIKQTRNKQKNQFSIDYRRSEFHTFSCKITGYVKPEYYCEKENSFTTWHERPIKSSLQPHSISFEIFEVHCSKKGLIL
jgi:hypothetical protein